MMSSAHGTHPLPVEHLDYGYIEQCSDVKYLGKILRVLRAGTEGVYPHLTDFCEKRIELLDPKNRALRKNSALATPASLPTEEWQVISQDLQAWQREITANEQQQQHTHSPVFYSDTLPPVHNRTQTPTDTSTKIQKSLSAVPQPYSYWDRYDVDKECTLIDECVSRDAVIRTPNITPTINASALTQQEKTALSTREREKGNDAYRAGDWDEAVLYYTRSVCILPTVAAYNNRAQAEIKLQRWSQALTDCNTALQLQPTNQKALLRRATIHTHLGKLQDARDDITTVVQSEPHNLTAQKILCEVNEKINTTSQLTTHQPNQPIRSTKLLIQEVENEHEDEEMDVPAESIIETPSTTETPPTIKAPPIASSSAQTRRRINIIEEEEEEEDEEEDNSIQDIDDDVTTFTPSNPFEFGQALKAACCHGDRATCAQLLRCVLPWNLPQYISTQLDTHTLYFITHTLHAYILPSDPSLVYQLLTYLHTAERFTTVLMLMGSEERHLISDLFNCLGSVQCEGFTHADVTQLYKKYTIPT